MPAKPQAAACAPLRFSPRVTTAGLAGFGDLDVDDVRLIFSPIGDGHVVAGADLARSGDCPRGPARPGDETSRWKRQPRISLALGDDFPPQPPLGVAFFCSVASSVVLRLLIRVHVRRAASPSRPGTVELLHEHKVSDCAWSSPCKSIRFGMMLPSLPQGVIC
jgi:hypothetical protein